MPKAEKDLFEDIMAKMMALPIIGVVYLVLRFWGVVPRTLSFTGSWLLVYFVLLVPLYYNVFIYPHMISPPLNAESGLRVELIYFSLDYPFFLHLFITLCFAIAVTLKKGLKASVNWWIIVPLILYVSISPLPVYRFDYQTPLFLLSVLRSIPRHGTPSVLSGNLLS